MKFHEITAGIKAQHEQKGENQKNKSFPCGLSEKHFQTNDL